MSAPIRVLHIRPINAGQLKASVKVRLGGLVLHGVKIIEPEGDEPYIAMPMAPTRGSEDGAKAAGWLPVVDIVSPALLDRVRDAVLASWRESVA